MSSTQRIPLDEDSLDTLRDFVENLTAPLHWVGPNGVILWANQAELDLLGYSRDEYVGHHIAEFHVDDWLIADMIARLGRNEVLHEHPSRLRHKDGSIRDVLINSSVLKRDGKFVHTRCLTIDVTSQRRATQERRRAEQRLAVQYAVTHVLAEADTLAAATPRLLKAVGDACGCALGTIWAVDESSDILRCADVWRSAALRGVGFEEISRQTTFERGVGLPGRAWSQGAPIWTEDGAFAFPIHARDHISGVLEFFLDEPRPSDPDTLRLLDAIGAQLGQFMLRRQAAEDRAHLATIVDGSDDAIISKTLDGIITSWNHGAERMFGWAAHEAIGRHVALIVPIERLADEDDVFARLRCRERIDHFQTERVARDGHSVNVSISVSPIRTPDGSLVGASMIARDITAQREMARALEKANLVKDEFLATLSRELRTPLNAVLGYTRLLRAGRIGDEGPADAVEAIERNAIALAQLVGDVLDVSSIVAGTVTLQREACDLVPIVGAAVEIIRPLANTKGISVRLHGPETPLPIRGDIARLQQLLWNLLSNAVKFTPTGGSIETRIETRQGTARVTVADTGAGIRPELLPYVFQRFWRGDSPATREAGGLGLGLALARHFVDLHDGTITAASAGEGRGATFTVILPLHQCADSARTRTCRSSRTRSDGYTIT